MEATSPLFSAAIQAQPLIQAADGQRACQQIASIACQYGVRISDLLGELSHHDEKVTADLVQTSKAMELRALPVLRAFYWACREAVKADPQMLQRQLEEISKDLSVPILLLAPLYMSLSREHAQTKTHPENLFQL